MSFHETFRLDRSRLTEVLRVAKHGGFSRAELEEASTSLGKNMRRAFPRWGVGAGLLRVDKNRYVLSAFGEKSLDHDPALHRLDTQWLMHYHLCAPEGPGPKFWHDIFAKIIRAAKPFTRGEIEDAIQSADAAKIRDKLVQSTATVFLRTYTDSAGLGSLQLIRPVKHERDRFELSLEAKPPSLWAFAYALVDHWGRVWQEQLTVGLDWLYQPGSLASLLLLDQSQVEDYLGRLQRDGWVEIFRVAPPFQLVRRWTDSKEKRRAALQRLYTDDTT